MVIELIQWIVRALRFSLKSSQSDWDDLLRRTSGIWKHGDGLAYQNRLRDEW